MRFDLDLYVLWIEASLHLTPLRGNKKIGESAGSADSPYSWRSGGPLVIFEPGVIPPQGRKMEPAVPPSSLYDWRLPVERPRISVRIFFAEKR